MKRAVGTVALSDQQTHAWLGNACQWNKRRYQEMAIKNSVPAHLTKDLVKHAATSFTQATADSALESNNAVPASGHDSETVDVRPFTYRAPVAETPDQDVAHPHRRRSDASRKETEI